MTNVIIELSKEQSDLLRKDGLRINAGDIYYHLPLFYKEVGENKYEIFHKDELPKEVKDIINPCNL